MNFSGIPVARLVCTAVLAGLVTACSAAGGGSGSGGGGSCADAVAFGGRTYLGASLRTQPPYDLAGEIPRSHLHRLGTGTILGCHDTNHGDAGPARRVEVARISLVSPATAIALRSDGRVYLARGARIPHRLATARWIRWVTP